jgi:hypothetical protein
VRLVWHPRSSIANALVFSPHLTMRLLQRLGADDFRLTDEFDKANIIPAYAILSHTWGPDEEEVIFEDIVK